MPLTWALITIIGGYYETLKIHNVGTSHPGLAYEQCLCS